MWFLSSSQIRTQVGVQVFNPLIKMDARTDKFNKIEIEDLPWVSDKEQSWLSFFIMSNQ